MFDEALLVLGDDLGNLGGGVRGVPMSVKCGRCKYDLVAINPLAEESERDWTCGYCELDFKNEALKAENRRLRMALEEAGEIICMDRCSQEQLNWQLCKGPMELGLNGFSIHLRNHGFINEALYPQAKP